MRYFPNETIKAVSAAMIVNLWESEHEKSSSPTPKIFAFYSPSLFWFPCWFFKNPFYPIFWEFQSLCFSHRRGRRLYNPIMSYTGILLLFEKIQGLYWEHTWYIKWFSNYFSICSLLIIFLSATEGTVSLSCY